MSTPEDSLVLSDRDVRRLLTMEDCVPIQEQVFALNAQGKAWNGENAWVNPNPHQQTLPAQGKVLTGGIEPNWWGVKNGFYGTQDPNGHRRVQTLLIFRSQNLCPVAVMDSMYLGNVRTGAGAAVATRFLARQEARVIGVLGTGATAWFSLMAHRAINWPVSRVVVYSRSAERRQKFANKLSTATDYIVEALDSPEKVVRQSEILITGTATLTPVMQASWVQEGTHINAMGQKYEIDPQLLTRVKLVGDEAKTAIRDGKISVAIESGLPINKRFCASLGEIIIQAKPGRTSKEEVTLFDSSGLCIQDLAAGLHVWQSAHEKGIGRRVQFHHNQSLW